MSHLCGRMFRIGLTTASLLSFLLPQPIKRSGKILIDSLVGSKFEIVVGLESDEEVFLIHLSYLDYRHYLPYYFHLSKH